MTPSFLPSRLFSYRNAAPATFPKERPCQGENRMVVALRQRPPAPHDKQVLPGRGRGKVAGGVAFLAGERGAAGGKEGDRGKSICGGRAGPWAADVFTAGPGWSAGGGKSGRGKREVLEEGGSDKNENRPFQLTLLFPSGSFQRLALLVSLVLYNHSINCDDRESTSNVRHVTHHKHKLLARLGR